MKFDPGAAVTGAAFGVIAAIATAFALVTTDIGHVGAASENRAIHDYLLNNPQVLVAMS